MIEEKAREAVGRSSYPAFLPDFSRCQGHVLYACAPDLVSLLAGFRRQISTAEYRSSSESPLMLVRALPVLSYKPELASHLRPPPVR